MTCADIFGPWNSSNNSLPFLLGRSLTPGTSTFLSELPCTSLYVFLYWNYSNFHYAVAYILFLSIINFLSDCFFKINLKDNNGKLAQSALSPPITGTDVSCANTAIQEGTSTSAAPYVNNRTTLDQSHSSRLDQVPPLHPQMVQRPRLQLVPRLLRRRRVLLRISLPNLRSALPLSWDLSELLSSKTSRFCIGS